ncbi:hypothetical protein EJD97_024695 [Solanum chilense]|uniref:SMP domain-containing protein n=1 Tax=Solanum chilense TaxID=4083 RepID=A0A6N2AS99_SOLCI|nr:hypothetical protein EJD97_024695 [Solanum chilense]
MVYKNGVLSLIKLSLMLKLMPRLEVGEKDDEGTIKDLRIGAKKGDVQDQNLVPQNSIQRLAVLDDYSSPNQQNCNSADRVEFEEKLAVDTNKSIDAEFAQKIDNIKEKGVVAENSTMRKGDKHTLEKLHDAIPTPKSDVQLKNLAIDGQNFEGSKIGDMQPFEPVDLQVEISSRD